jgi:hypothetical protein
MNNTIAILAWSGVALLMLPVRTHAEIVVADSTEWVLATSDLVLIGKAVKVEEVLDRENKPCQAVTVAVSKTLKGKKTEREIFLLPSWFYQEHAKQWVEEGIPIAFCLIKNDGKRISISPDKFAWIIRHDGNGVNTILLGKSNYYWTGCKPVLTRDFEVITEARAILKFVEANTGSGGAIPRSHTLAVPGNTAVYKLLWSLSAVYLVVPIDEKLELLGKKWCLSASSFDRREGARILQYFKNEENIHLLKSLLNDPNYSDGTRHRTVSGKSELELVYRKRFFYVRQAAFNALGKLEVKVDPPVLEELLEGRDEKE